MVAGCAAIHAVASYQHRLASFSARRVRWRCGPHRPPHLSGLVGPSARVGEHGLAMVPCWWRRAGVPLKLFIGITGANSYALHGRQVHVPERQG